MTLKKMLFNQMESTEMSTDSTIQRDYSLCRGCDVSLSADEKTRGWFCGFCKGKAEDQYSGFWSAIKVTHREASLIGDSYAIGEFASYITADICVSQRRWIEGFQTVEEVSVVLMALAAFHKGYVVSDTQTTYSHPVYEWR